MSRELETYRLHLEQILKYFNDKQILSVADVSRYTGRSEPWCRKHLGVTGEGTTAVKLALAMARKD